ncbi:MAG: hypothetical protein QOJ58_1828 [Alphaproteobacteria bacterium]|nr:hypothetical protein [Alphaproteobacteria bacterium]
MRPRRAHSLRPETMKNKDINDAHDRAKSSARPPTSRVGDAMIIPDAIGKLCALYTRFG